jgi:heptosyltransferase-2
MFKGNNINTKNKIISFGIGAYAEKRIWPPENFAVLMSTINNTGIGTFKFLILGSAHDSVNASYIMKSVPPEVKNNIIDLTGKMTINEICALLTFSDIFVGNDSGLMHLACANTKKIVEISCHPSSGNHYHPNSPVRFGAIAESTKVFQPLKTTLPCKDFCSSEDSHCIRNIHPSTVSNYICKLLKVVC